MQERCKFIANALELCLSCTNPSKCAIDSFKDSKDSGIGWNVKIYRSDLIFNQSQRNYFYYQAPLLCDTDPDFYIDGLVEDCIISIANALEILQSCTKPSIYHWDNLALCQLNIPCVKQNRTWISSTWNLPLLQWQKFGLMIVNRVA